MKRKYIYTKYALRSFRTISILCAIFLLIIEAYLLCKTSKIELRNLRLILTVVINLISLFFFIFTSILPHRLGSLSFIAYIYATFIIPIEPENYMGILMYFLGTALLMVRGFFKKQKKVKIYILYLFLFALNLTHLRYGFLTFLDYFVKSLGGILVLCLYTFFLQAHYINTLVYEDKKLNIASYPKLTERDCRILQRIQKGEKYSVIARDENITEGSLKNRLHFVFSTMETGDKQGFLSYYDDYELYFDPADVKLPDSQEDLLQ